MAPWHLKVEIAAQFSKISQGHGVLVNERGVVELKGNELGGAKSYRDRYYLYRVYEKTKAEYIVVALCNPLGQKDALNENWEVDLFRAAQTQRYRIEVEECEPESSKLSQELSSSPPPSV